MKNKLFLFIFFVFIQLSFPGFMEAHGTGYRILSNRKTVTWEFYYSDGKPMSYAKVLVFSPIDEKTEYQNGRTDRLGKFTFCPDTPGTWRIEINDGMGHKVLGSVRVSELKFSKTKTNRKNNVQNNQGKNSLMLLKCVFGLSLIFNLCFVLYLWKRKNKEQSK